MDPLIPYFQSIRFIIPLPDAFPRDHLTVYGFGICVAAGVLLGRFVAARRARRLGIDERLINAAFLWVILAVVVGGHIGYGLFYHPQEYFANPMLFLDLGAGLSSFGGFIFAVIALVILARRYQQALLPFSDSIVIGFTLGWFFGRMGCTLNHEHPGTATRAFFGRYCRPVEGHTLQWPQWMSPKLGDLRFSHCIEQGLPVLSYSDTVNTQYSGVIAVHDMGLYEAIYALLMFIVFRFLDRKPRQAGFYTLALLLSYCPLRFAMDFLRPLEANIRYAGLTPAQWGCALFFVLGLLLWHKIRTSQPSTHTALSDSS